MVLIKKILKYLNCRVILQKGKSTKPVSVISGAIKGFIYFPDWSNYNPYQGLFYKNLNKMYGFSAYGFDAKQFNKNVILKYKKKAKILHIHWINALYQINDENSINYFFSNLKFSQQNGYKIFWTVHNFVSHEVENQSREIKIRKQLGDIVDRIIVHGYYAKMTICNEYGIANEKVHIIPHGHYASFYRNEISKNEARDVLKIEKNDFVFLFFGNIRAYKGLEDLLDVFSRINKQHDNVTLLIAGRGLDDSIIEKLKVEANLNKKINHHIRHIPDDEVQVFLNAADVMILPYRRVLTSGAALLALTFKLPIIAPSIGLITELVEDKIGFLYKTIDDMENLMKDCVEKNHLKKLDYRNIDEKLVELSWENIIRNELFYEFSG
jgi:glycosyltransferase involved in cell wall biosynthesis